MRTAGLLLAFTGCIQHAAIAAPMVSVRWMDCSSSAVNRQRTDAGTTTIVVTARGLVGPIRAHDVRVKIGRAYYIGLPDAWRFDPEGCNGAGFTASGAGESGCPSLVGDHSVSIARFDYLDNGGRAVFAASYDPRDVDPAVTYTLAKFVLDQAPEDVCGCLAQPMCLHISYAAWLDADQNEQVFGVEREYLTWEDPGNNIGCPAAPLCSGPGCDPSPYACYGATPARSMSWGGIKASYR